ncbi:hypothetical protein IW262DRAFT_1281407, partial [Armillaria fumosa]
STRTLIRSETAKVRFVTAKEPTSVLDSKVKCALFGNINQAWEEKTKIGLMHQLEHLTNHADVIVCTKDETIVEACTDEPMVMEVENAKLYNIQASIFFDEEPS